MTEKSSRRIRLVIGILYIPLSLFCLLLTMASEGMIDATNPDYLLCMQVFCVIMYAVPLLCAVAFWLSCVLQERKQYGWSAAMLMLPIAVFAVGLLLLDVSGAIPRTL
ncbi:MAG: hypothetical protein IJB27_02340 [Clostridia bacterium]|nr:hypothetical protein [Clostridia bacterium]